MNGQTKVVNMTLSQLLRCFVGKSLRFNPLTHLDLLHLPNVASKLNEDGLSKAQFMKKLYERARSHIENKRNQYAKYVNKGKREKIYRRISDNAYVVYMPQEYGNSTLALNLSTNSLQEGKNDISMGKQVEDTKEGINKKDRITLQGSMTRGRMERIQQAVQLYTRMLPSARSCTISMTLHGHAKNLHGRAQSARAVLHEDNHTQ
ncbi:hypothetical protein CR513_48097, partial [Mucuna pruriens]